MDEVRYSAAHNRWELVGQFPTGVEHVSPQLENGAVLVFTGPHTGGLSLVEKALLYFP